ncbi:hypothetical protein H1S01_16690 [Heliobacterium chlorum]|uniref:Uncharacterized protein n=1 Tax=Heliobacterium chlorum TaxID=2698 RepID=A0ABR7T5P9_HELCL|nr:hypothetical protein [Heliobacterium chlorum]MBC9786107.1 hypothetical protein [Heliobacterium chlorum]
MASQTDGSNYLDKYNAIHKFFGEILKGRAIFGAQNESKLEVTYGFLIKEPDFNFFNQYYRIIKADWNIFGKAFNCKYVVIFSEKNKELRFVNWHNCWN